MRLRVSLGHGGGVQRGHAPAHREGARRARARGVSEGDVRRDRVRAQLQGLQGQGRVRPLRRAAAQPVAQRRSAQPAESLGVRGGALERHGQARRRRAHQQRVHGGEPGRPRRDGLAFGGGPHHHRGGAACFGGGARRREGRRAQLHGVEDGAGHRQPRHAGREQEAHLRSGGVTDARPVPERAPAPVGQSRVLVRRRAVEPGV